MNDFEYDEMLKHYGIKGMRWGVRRSEKQLARNRKKLTPEEGEAKLSSLDKQIRSTKDKTRLKSLKKQYGEVEDSIDYTKPKKRQNGDKGPGIVRQQVASAKRTGELRKKAMDAARSRKEMSTADMNKLANRMQLENDFRRLRRNKFIATKDDKRDFRLRANLTDEQLRERVNRLRAKDLLIKRAFAVDKDIKKIGETIVKEAKKRQSQS